MVARQTRTIVPEQGSPALLKSSHFMQLASFGSALLLLDYHWPLLCTALPQVKEHEQQPEQGGATVQQVCLV